MGLNNRKLFRRCCCCGAAWPNARLAWSTRNATNPNLTMQMALDNNNFYHHHQPPTQTRPQLNLQITNCLGHRRRHATAPTTMTNANGVLSIGSRNLKQPAPLVWHCGNPLICTRSRLVSNIVLSSPGERSILKFNIIATRVSSGAGEIRLKTSRRRQR